MTWFKVDDKLSFHTKAIRAGNAAMGAWVRLGAWTSEREMDGVIPYEVALLIASKNEIEKLIDVGFLLGHSIGYELYDYLKYNPSRAQLEAKRSEWAEKKTGQRKRSVTGMSLVDSHRDTRGDSPEDSRESPGTGTGSGSGSDPETENPDGSGHRASPLTPAEETRVRHISSHPPAMVVPKPVDPLVAQTREVFAYWAEKLYPRASPKFSEERRKKIHARLVDGYSVERLKRAVDGAMRDDWLMGRKEGSPKGGYRDAITLFKSCAQVERLEAMCPTPGQGRPMNDDHESERGTESTGVRRLVREAPSETPLSLEENAKRAATLAGLMRKIGGGAA